MVVTNRESWAYERPRLQIVGRCNRVGDFERPREITGAVGAAIGVADSYGRHGDLQRVLERN